MRLLAAPAAGASTGGRAYGYVPAYASGTGLIELNPSEAAVVVRIFELYQQGHSPRAIAARLNAEEVPSHQERDGRT